MVLSGSQFIYLDPMVHTLSSEVLMFDFQNKEDQSVFLNFSDFSLFKSIFKVNEEGFNGTLFRFPLRQHKSELSEYCYNNNQLNILIQSFKKDGYLNLLFLKNIKSIELSRIKKGSKVIELEYSVALTMDCNQKYGKTKMQFIENLRHKVHSLSYSEITANYEVEILEKEANLPDIYYSYYISEYYGSSSPDYKKLQDLNLLPLVAVAYPQETIKIRDVGGHIFCVLPLPMLQKGITGLPIHVNGFFALSEDRYDLKWSTDPKNTNNEQALWNCFLITKLLPVAYNNLLKYVMEESASSDIVYNCWPKKDIVEKKWHQLLKPFFENVSQSKCICWNFRKEWVYPTECIILQPSLFSSEEQCLVIKDYLERCGEKIAIVPTHVQSYFNTLKLVSRSSVQTTVKKCINLYESCKKSDKLHILKFILVEMSDFNKLQLLPLLPMNDGTFGSIKPKNMGSPIYIVTDSHPLDIFPYNQNFLEMKHFQQNDALMKTFQLAAKTGF